MKTASSIMAGGTRRQRIIITEMSVFELSNDADDRKTFIASYPALSREIATGPV